MLSQNRVDVVSVVKMSGNQNNPTADLFAQLILLTSQYQVLQYLPEGFMPQ